MHDTVSHMAQRGRKTISDVRCQHGNILSLIEPELEFGDIVSLAKAVREGFSDRDHPYWVRHRRFAPFDPHGVRVVP